MRTLFHTISCLLLFTTNTVCAQYCNDLKKSQLNYNVKSVVQQEWVLRDSSGKTIPQKPVVPVGLTGYKTTFTKKGFVSKCSDLDSGNVQKCFFCNYIAEKNYALVNCVNPVNTSSVEEGNLLSDVRYYENKKITGSIKYEYEELDDNTCNVYMIKNNGPRHKVEEKTKSKDGITLTVKSFENDTLYSTTQYTYQGGHLSEMTTTYPDGRKTTCSWRLDMKAGGIKQQGLKTVYDQEGKKVSSTSYYYDKAGNLVRETIYNNKTNSTSAVLYEYSFDRYNWITRKTYWLNGSKKTLQYMAERTIEYYQ